MDSNRSMASVKRRSYDASRRQERALTNRKAMLDAAIELLVEQGYADTTLALVAKRAGVAAPTVYKAFGNKPGHREGGLRICVRR